MPIYHCYGLTFDSEIELPDCLPGNADEVRAHVRKANLNPIQIDGWYRVEGRRIESEPTPGGFRAVIEGSLARVDCYLPELEHAFPAYFPANCMAALILGSNLLPLHGNAMLAPGREGAFVILGNPGAGKSTTSARLVERGFSLLSDDLCTIEENDQGAFFVHAGNPRLKLWADSFTRLDLEPASGSPVPTLPGKFYVPMPPVEPIARQLDHFVILRTTEANTSTIRSLTGAEKLGALAEHLYRFRLHELMLGFPWVLERLTELANRFPVFEIERPVAGETLDEVVSLVESTLDPT